MCSNNIYLIAMKLWGVEVDYIACLTHPVCVVSLVEVDIL